MASFVGTGLTVIVIVALGWFFFFGGEVPNANVVSEERTINEITLDAKRFEYSEQVVRVKSGENVAIKINNLDTLHGIYIPDLGVSGKDNIEFVAPEPGEYPFYCAVMCGPGHHNMGGKLIVE